jgi:putative intracellular protease/amidase
VVCHAPAAFLAAERSDGSFTFAGYKATGFSNAEETQAGLADKAPWLLQDRLVQLGVDYQEGEPWAPKVVVDRNLYTGQNPASSAPLAQRIIADLG